MCALASIVSYIHAICCLAGHMPGDRQAEAEPAASDGGAPGCSQSQAQGRGRGAVKSNSEGGGIMQLSQALRDHMNMETRLEGTRERGY